MGLLGPILMVALMVATTESQVVFPSRNSLNKADQCTASNGQTGFCYEYRSRKFQECSFFPSLDSSNPNIAGHLRANICKNTGKELFLCCPSNTALPIRQPIRQPIAKGSCAAIRCQANAQCVEGRRNELTKCNCNLGYKSYQNRCLATCKVKACQANALCVEGSGAAASVCLCKKGYRSQNGNCLPTCKVKNCQENALCVEGSGAAASICMCKNGYRPHNGNCLRIGLGSCAAIRCQANAQCVEGRRNELTKCNCNFGYRSYQNMCIATCQATNCPKNARCLEGIGSTNPSCKCHKGYKSTRTECIEHTPRNTVTQRPNTNRPNNQGFGGSSAFQNQRYSWNRNPAPNHFTIQYHYPNQQRPYNRIG